MPSYHIAERTVASRYAFACIAVLSVQILAKPLFAVNSVVVESKTFAPGQTACSVGVFITNDVPIVGLVVPLELRTVEGGAYITGPFPSSFKFQAVPGNRLDNSPLGSASELWPEAIRITSMFSTPATSGELCSGPLSSSYTQATSSLDGVSPGAVMHAAVSTGDPAIGEEFELQPGADPDSTSHASLRFIFNVNSATGFFRIDSCCRTPSSNLAMIASVDARPVEVSLQFIRGIISIGDSSGGGDPSQNTPPIAACVDSVVLFASSDCFGHPAADDVNDGSWDAEDGTNLAMALTPPGPYRIGRHGVRLIVCDQDGDCASCSTVVIVRDSIPISLMAGRDSVFLEYSGDPETDHLCEEVAILASGCGAILSSSVDVQGMLTGAEISRGSDHSRTLTFCVSPYVQNVPNGVYEALVIVRLLFRPERDTIHVVINVHHGPIEAGCDSVYGFVRTIDGEPVEHARVVVLVCDSSGYDCGTIPGVFPFTDAQGWFSVATWGWPSLRLVVNVGGGVVTEIPIDECDMPLYVYTELPDIVIPGASPPPTVGPMCANHGFVYANRANPHTIAGASAELWDSYPDGSIIASDTADAFGHFGFGIKSGDAVVRAPGFCPRILENIDCSFQAVHITLDSLPFSAPPNWPYFCDYYSTNAQFVSEGVHYPIMPGDVIYATDPEGVICGVTWIETDGTYLIHVLGDDPETTLDEGAVEGDSVTLWRNCECAVIAPQAWVNFGSFQFDALWDCEIVPLCCALCEGWNMWSHNIALASYARTDVLASIDLSYDAVRSGLCDYGSMSWFNSRPINDLEDMSPWFGYDIHMLQEDTVCLEGEAIDPSTSINLCAGWNYIPYLPESADNLSHALQSLSGNVSHIFTMYCDYGVVSWNASREPQNNDLNCMEPCKGYWIEMLSDDTLVYPEPEGCDPLAKVGSRAIAGRVMATPLVADYYAPASNIAPGSVISARSSSGALIGEASVGTNGSFLIHVYGDVPFTAGIEGAVHGEALRFEINGVTATVDRDIRWTDRDNQSIELSPGVAAAIPTEYALHQNYPNPFNAGTVIQFDLKEAANWTVTIYNVMGQHVRDFTGQSATGRLQLHWDGRSEAGLPLASGVYFYRLSANGFTDFKKMMLVK